MLRPLPVFLAFALAAVAGAAQDTGAPLEATKEELRKLRNDERARKGPATSDRAGNDAPHLTIAPADDPAEVWLQKRLKKERKEEREKGETQKNWLIDGMARLEQEAKDKPATPNSAPKQPSATTVAPTKADPSDPQYLLKLFDEQKKGTDRPASPAKSTTPAPDPFAPFLQNWLGTSPVRGEVLDQLTRRTETTAPVTAPGHAPARVATNPEKPITLPATRDTVAMERTNPYLAEMNAPVIARELSEPQSTIVTPFSTPLLGSETGKTAAPLIPLEPAAAPVREPVRSPLQNPADEKKYFPQLKRF